MWAFLFKESVCMHLTPSHAAQIKREASIAGGGSRSSSRLSWNLPPRMDDKINPMTHTYMKWTVLAGWCTPHLCKLLQTDGKFSYFAKCLLFEMAVLHCIAFFYISARHSVAKSVPPFFIVTNWSRPFLFVAISICVPFFSASAVAGQHFNLEIKVISGRIPFVDSVHSCAQLPRPSVKKKAAYREQCRFTIIITKKCLLYTTT